MNLVVVDAGSEHASSAGRLARTDRTAIEAGTCGAAAGTAEGGRDRHLVGRGNGESHRMLPVVDRHHAVPSLEHEQANQVTEDNRRRNHQPITHGGDLPIVV